MSTLADQITAELGVLIGEPLSACWRVANMQVFEFGPMHEMLNRKGKKVNGSDLRLHVQCRWRIVDGKHILFGCDDLLKPANAEIPIDEFDWDKDDACLDVAQRNWFLEHRDAPLQVVSAMGDNYGGCRIQLQDRVSLELFPCDSDRSESSEHWRMFHSDPNKSHFVITGNGVEN